MEIKNQIKQINKIMRKLYLEKKWETSTLSRLFRAIRFHLGVSQCRYCVYFQPEYGDHQTKREDSILTKGKCDWSKIAGVDIDKKMATKLKRCSGFVPALFNIKGYSIPKEEVKDILLQRRNYFFSWWTIIIAIIAATISWFQTKEARKERIKAEEAVATANKAEESIIKITNTLFKISYVLADGAGRYSGMPKEHFNEIKKYQDSVGSYLDENLESEIKKDIRKINDEINLKNKQNP